MRTFINYNAENIEEGKDYFFISNGKLMGGTVVTCEACNKFCYVNGFNVMKNPKGIVPVKSLENLEEMAGYSEERERCECIDCSV